MAVLDLRHLNVCQFLRYSVLKKRMLFREKGFLGFWFGGIVRAEVVIVVLERFFAWRADFWFRGVILRGNCCEFLGGCC